MNDSVHIHSTSDGHKQRIPSHTNILANNTADAAAKVALCPSPHTSCF